VLSQFQILAELAADRSSWLDIRHYPPTVTCRRMLRLADFAAAEPSRWNTCHMSWECPELSFRDIAAITGRGMSVVQKHVAAIDLSDAGDFTEGELGIYPGDALPAWLRGRPEKFDGVAPSLTYRRGRRLADFAAAAPKRWRAVRYHVTYPDATQPEIADALGISQQTISNYLQPFRLDEADDFEDEIL